MSAVIMHADGSDCLHEGPPAPGDDGPVCPAGLLARSFAESLAPLIAAFTEMADAIGSILAPQLRALSAPGEDSARTGGEL
jgi:hypothetical protein